MSPILVGLQGVCQTYAWGVKGSASLVAATAKQTDPSFKTDENTPYAELWLGAHPSAAAVALLQDGTKMSVLDWLKNQKLPFLFKVLSIAQPLSLQLHPDEENAARLHQEDPAHYPDPFSKPEAAIALSDPAEAFCGFRRLRDIVMLAQSIPAFGKIVFGEGGADQAPTEGQDESQLLSQMMKNLYAFSNSEIEELVEETLALNPETTLPVKKEPTVFVSALRTLKSMFKDDQMTPAELLKVTLMLFRRLHESFPSDRGLFACFFLNYVRMKPGEVIVLAPNTIHAYIAGNMLEVMKTSDNVVRAGLTPKFQDVQRLLELVTYKSLSISSSLIKPQDVVGRTEGSSGKISIKAYIPQITDSFRFYTINLSPGGFLKDARIPDWSPMMVFVLRGSCEVIATQVLVDDSHEGTIEESRVLKAGQACLLESENCLGIRNLSEKQAKHGLSGMSSPSTVTGPSPFLVTDLEAAAAEKEVVLIVIVSNPDPNRLKRSARPSARAAVSEPVVNASPPSVAEFPVVTPLEQAAYDAAEPVSNTIRGATPVSLPASGPPFPDEATQEMVSAEPVYSEPISGSSGSRGDDEAAPEGLSTPQSGSSKGTTGMVQPVTAEVTPAEVVRSPKVVNATGTSTDMAVVEQVATTPTVTVNAATTLEAGFEEVASQEILTPSRDVSGVETTGSSPVSDRAGELPKLETTDAPVLEAKPPRKPAFTANEIAEAKIARTIAKQTSVKAASLDQSVEEAQ